LNQHDFRGFNPGFYYVLADMLGWSGLGNFTNTSSHSKHAALFPAGTSSTPFGNDETLEDDNLPGFQDGSTLLAEE
jgi:hypothetical protein